MKKIFGLLAIVIIGTGLAFFLNHSDDTKLSDLSAKELKFQKSEKTNVVDDEIDKIRENAHAAQNKKSGGSNFGDVLKQVDGITAKMDGTEYYGIFRALTDNVRAHPEYSSEVAKKILSITQRDPGSRRQLSAMFGALAESRHTEGIDTLASLANDCPDNACKVQAIMGVNTHVKPSLANGNAMLEIARNSPDREVAATALIAAGAVGRKIEDTGDIPEELIRVYGDSSKADMKTSTIAAMGNHGSPDYLPLLNEGLKSADSRLRSASVYSLRHVKGEAADTSILNSIANEKVSRVVSEALKASAYRDFSADEYLQLAKSAAGFKSKELTQQAALILLEANRTNSSAAQSALTTFRENIKFADVRDFIDREVTQGRTRNEAQ